MRNREFYVFGKLWREHKIFPSKFASLYVVHTRARREAHSQNRASGSQLAKQPATIGSQSSSSSGSIVIDVLQLQREKK